MRIIRLTKSFLNKIGIMTNNIFFVFKLYFKTIIQFLICRDIVLSSAGWAMVTTPVGEKSTFIAYTPGGKGIAERQPFLPHSCKFRGKRILGSPTYRNDRLYLDYIEHKHLEL